VAFVVLLLPMVFSIPYNFELTVYDFHSDNTTIFHSKIPFTDSIRRFLSTQVSLFCCYLASIGEWTDIASTVTFNDPSDSSPTIFYHRYNVIDPFDIDTDADNAAAVMLLLMMVMLLL